MPEGYTVASNVVNNNETIVEEVAVQAVVTQRKRDNKVLTKYSKPDSSTSIDSPNNKTIKEEEISFSKDPF